MAYLSLYRKYRPDTFDKVIGQDHVVKTLRNQILSGNIGHAYIFTGTRGTGKTSVAKIFARAVNCLDPKDGSPCGVCANCTALSNPSNFDITELDAASNNSVDQIRELTDKISFPPTVGRYKVYIVDEVHMLSKSAYNALLKTLEEPPSHAIFILATTEIHQIPATILSRCLRFDFRLVPDRVIADRIEYIFDDCGVKYEPQAAELIAASGAGSVRDALSVADMCVSYCGGSVTYEGVLEVLGASDPNKVLAIADAAAGKDIDRALSLTAEIADMGKSVSVLASDIAAAVRNALYIKSCKRAKQLLSLPDEYYDKLKDFADRYSYDRLMSVMKKMTGLEGDFRYSSQHRLLFEAALISAACAEEGSDTPAENRIAQLERKLAQLQKQGFRAAPDKRDAKQVWKAVASELEYRRQDFLAFAIIEGEPEIKDDVFVVRMREKATLSLLTDKSNRDMINAVFSLFSDMKLVFEDYKKLDDDKALPYIKDMFGNRLTLK